jgi:hypothetical protein
VKQITLAGQIGPAVGLRPRDSHMFNPTERGRRSLFVKCERLKLDSGRVSARRSRSKHSGDFPQPKNDSAPGCAHDSRAAPKYLVLQMIRSKAKI